MQIDISTGLVSYKIRPDVNVVERHVQNKN